MTDALGDLIRTMLQIWSGIYAFWTDFLPGIFDTVAGHLTVVSIGGANPFSFLIQDETWSPLTCSS